ncbi:unnamed protein product [Camellia sinensis]
MASSFQLPFLLFMFLHFILLLSKPVHCDGIEDSLLNGINNHRKILNLQLLSKNHKVMCLAEQIVTNQLDSETCTNMRPITIATMGSHPQLPTDYPNLLKVCKIKNSMTRDGVILPICVAKIVGTSIACTNCMQSQYSKYLSSSNYTRVGIYSGETWMVIILTTNASTLVSSVGLSHYFLLLLLELFLVLLN